MKLSIYVDIEPWMLTSPHWDITGHSIPPPKGKNAYRYRLDFDISEDINDPDEVIKVHASRLEEE